MSIITEVILHQEFKNAELYTPHPHYHIHLIFSERKLLDEPVEKTATRNMFYDENGKHVRTKKEILDEVGQLRCGCKIISKSNWYQCHNTLFNYSKGF